ncbi:protease pro-enzyme activation domain-containing protein [Nevskia soli]|uniref:protease pro-enzyme activation domain-containing protein n=1 Tax=Nevskia soli TaxID=418856 RepID=UPI0009FEC764|nr:protease pro-enzyme activation domain-containing protein [Nevskia soli]
MSGKSLLQKLFDGRRRSLLAGGMLLALLAAPLPSLAAWEATLSKAVTPDASAGMAPVPAATTMNVHLSLKIQNKDALDALLKNLYTPGNPQYGQYLTPAQFAAAFSPSEAQAQKVVDYLRSAGFSNVRLAGNRLLVSATGTAAVVQKAFNTQLVLVPRNGRIVRANVKDLQVPDSLGGIVLAVLGPNNMAEFKTSLEQQEARAVLTPLTPNASRALGMLKGASAAAAAAGQVITAFPPTAWDVAYDAGTSPDGSQSTIAISTYGSENVSVVDDLRQMERQYGLPYVPVEVRETAPFSVPTPTGAGDDEWDLDTQSSTAIAHNVKKLIIYASESTTDLISQYNDFATSGDAIAGNMSYGTCELLAPTGLLLPDIASSDQAFEQAAVEGLSWHASTGDDGGVCSPINLLGAPLAGIPLLANYPDSSPYVVAVGGTSLVTDAKFNYSSETAWLSGGGGISVLEAAPIWQKGIVPSYGLTNIPGLGLFGKLLGGTGVGRGVPDISMDAGIYLPEVAIAASADTIVGGTHYAVVGTSLSSPLAVGAWARLQSAHCNALGFAAPAYYKLDTAGGLFSTATGFHDVTTGTNGDYIATTGWDYTTGFGSIDLAAVNAALPAASGNCVAPRPPVARLKSGASSGPAPLNVGFDASSSSDPAGDTIEYYTLDFGDDTLPLQQLVPVFAPHTYASPGVYTASLTVRNAHGAVSAPVTQTVTVAGVPTACTVPGKTLVTSPAGSSSIPLPVPIVGSLLPVVPDPLPGQDLLTASVAEPTNMPGKLVFTLKVDTLATVTPLTRWAVFFTLPGDTTAYYVSMSTDSLTPTFRYGKRGSLGGVKISALGLLTLYQDIGSLDAASGFNADGTITLVLDKSVLKLSTGETLQGILSTTAILIDLPPSIAGAGTQIAVGETVDAAGTRFGYTLIGNDSCGTGSGSSSSSGGSGSSSSGSGSSSGASSSGGSSSGSSSSGGSSSGSSSGSASSSGSGSSSGSSSSGSSSSGSGSSSSGSSSTSSGSASSSSSSSSSSSGGGSSGGASSSSGGTSSSSSSGSTTSSSSSGSGSSSGGTAPGSSSSGVSGSSSSSGGSGGGGGGGAFGLFTLLPLGVAVLRRRRRQG